MYRLVITAMTINASSVHPYVPTCNSSVSRSVIKIVAGIKWRLVIYLAKIQIYLSFLLSVLVFFFQGL